MVKKEKIKAIASKCQKTRLQISLSSKKKNFIRMILEIKQI